MATIPLKQFPPDFHPVCFKCRSSNVHFNLTKHPWMWNGSELQFSCGTCGSTAYGEDSIVAKFSIQMTEWRKDSQERARFAAAERIRLAEETRLEAIKAERERQAAIQDMEERILREAQAEAARLEAEAAAEAQAAATRAVWDPSGMAQKARDRSARLAALIAAGETALDRKRRADRESKARSRARKRELAATQPVPEPVVLPPDQEARRQAQIEKKRAYDRERTARIRAARQEAAALASAEREEAARVVAAQVIEDALEPEVPADDEPRCAWQECDKPRTATSKYCSRRCSNRFAAWNAKHKGKSA
jgi:hypothetical protein